MDAARISSLLVSLVLAAIAPATASGQGLPTLRPGQTLRPNVQGTGDQFGRSVSMEGELIVVGARLGFEDLGVAHVFEFSPVEGQWNEVDALTSASGTHFTLFGHSVGISGTTIVVSAPNEVTAGYPGIGVVSVFEQMSVDPPDWELVAELRSSDTSKDFGHTVAISGDTILVGAPALLEGPGAAYVFERDLGGPDAWGEAQKLTVPNGVNHISFGDAVAIDGDTAIVSRVRSSGVQTPTKIHVFERPPGASSGWAPAAVLHGSDLANIDDARIGIAGDVIASIGDRSGAGDRLLIYERGAAGSWPRVGDFEEPGGSVFFGQTVGLSQDTVLVGCTFCNTLSGAVYLVQRGPTGRWSLNGVYEIGASLSYLGAAVDVEGQTAVFGSTGRSSTGVAYAAHIPYYGPVEAPAFTRR